MKDGSTELLELEIFECGPCLQAANPLMDVLSVKSATPTTAPKASEDVAHMRQHLRTGHSVSKVATSGKTMRELQATHAIAHSEVPASAEHVRTGSTDGDVEITTAGKSELAAYKARIAKLEGRHGARRVKRRCAPRTTGYMTSTCSPTGSKSRRPTRRSSASASTDASKRRGSVRSRGRKHAVDSMNIVRSGDLPRVANMPG